MMAGHFAEADILQDRAPLRSAYEFRDYESSDALKKVTIRLPDGSASNMRMSPTCHR